MRSATKHRRRTLIGWLRLLLLLALPGRIVLCPPALQAQTNGTTAFMVAHPTPESEKAAAELGIGRWIWTTNFADKQTCRLWRAFTLPASNAVHKAVLRITADNQYRIFLDGREIGQGANWRSLTDYDLTWLMTPGSHVLAVEGFNDGLEAGVILGFHVYFADGQQFKTLSDSSWYVVPNEARRWLNRQSVAPDWLPAQEVGVVGQQPWWLQPVSILSPPPLHPLVLHFWQSGWFLGTILSVCGVALAMSVWLATKLAGQTRAQRLIKVERARIARDIHDDLGAALTQLVLQGEVAQVEFTEGSPAREHLGRLCARARAASQALDEVVWTVNSKRDTLRDFANYVCKYAQVFLNPTPIRCRLDVEPDLPATMFNLPLRRNLFLAVKEALNNAAKHSGAAELFLRIYRAEDRLVVTVEDDGQGFDPAQLSGERNGLANMTQRMDEINGVCELSSQPGGGCRVVFTVPLENQAQRGWLNWLQRRPAPDAATTQIQ